MSRKRSFGQSGWSCDDYDRFVAARLKAKRREIQANKVALMSAFEDPTPSEGRPLVGEREVLATGPELEGQDSGTTGRARGISSETERSEPTRPAPAAHWKRPLLMGRPTARARDNTGEARSHETETLVRFLRSGRIARPKAVQAAAVYASGRLPSGTPPPAIEVSASVPAGSSQLALSSSATYYWFAFVLSSDGTMIVPPYFRDENGRSRSRFLRPSAGRQHQIEIADVSKGTAYALASTQDFLPDPVLEDAALEDALLRGVRTLRAQRRPLFFMEYPFGSP